MTQEKWLETKIQIQNAFPDANYAQSGSVEDDDGLMETLEFTGPLGRMRLEYATKPLVLDKVVSGSRRIGSHHEVKFILSETEVTRTFKAYKRSEDEDEWTEIDLKNSFSL